MNFKKVIYLLCITCSLISTSMAVSRDYVIYSIVQDFPMGEPNEIIKKNFYINMGSNQGIMKGAVLDVFRNIARNDPYTNKKTYYHSVKIGELQVLHSENENAIATLKQNLKEDLTAPLFEIKKFMIGDKVAVKID